MPNEITKLSRQISSTPHVSRGRFAKQNTYLWWLLLSLLLGKAGAVVDRPHQVCHVNMHITFMIMAATAIAGIRWFYLEYLPYRATRRVIHSQESDQESSPVLTSRSCGNPLSSLSHFYRDKTICSGSQSPQHSSSYPTFPSILLYPHLKETSWRPILPTFLKR